MVQEIIKSVSLSQVLFAEIGTRLCIEIFFDSISVKTIIESKSRLYYV